MKSGTSSIFWKTSLSMILIAGLMVTLQACSDKDLKPAYQTEYQAIFTTSGHVMFGRIEKVTPTYMIVKDVYIIQSRIDPTTKATVQFVANRVNQYHKPDLTYLNPSTVSMTEPVAPDSQVAKWIKEEKEKAQTKK
jgi:hypothetical protein